jgi:Ran-binding protein 1
MSTEEKPDTATTPEEPAKTQEEPKEEESTATFEPVVKLEEVEVKSGEEEEVRFQDSSCL